MSGPQIPRPGRRLPDWWRPSDAELAEHEQSAKPRRAKPRHGPIFWAAMWLAGVIGAYLALVAVLFAVGVLP